MSSPLIPRHSDFIPHHHATAPSVREWDAMLRAYSSFAALSVLLYEQCTTLSSEFELVWTRPITFVKCLYVICRYLAIAWQITSQVFLLQLDLENPYSYKQCIAWHSIHTAVSQILLFVIECIQAMKVHALYSERRRTLYMLHLFRTISFIMITYTTVATLLVLSYDGACIVSDIPQQVTWFGALAILSQLIVTFLGMSPSVLKEILRQSSLIATMSRDSFLMFGIITVFSAIIIRYAALMAHVIPQFFLSTLSVIGCRMILNMLETASREGDTIRTASVHLSMFLDGSFVSGEMESL
ncbi:hypothetical protein PTI98_003927 [Pleurotus ostreatus]|nr:hypothetical protein PTI98_003927 [Pleurotus ostreatus]